MAGSDLTPVIISDEVALDADGISTAGCYVTFIVATMDLMMFYHA